ncbi:DUF7344 domain-containing protein [Haloplanus aerogenes]|uniref:DUF7344 domain-containing protein n=1 Tax=Haloplanus aerogenes TaxID=660522 RepID=A0A3M0CW28_9EURY|nr:hypothetical protein [Haloplanus aerogenes]AZH26552.1 hypothetical protein DU502_14740 [Haloplanus aerogenes]RMB12780.1 hypothetical protein ATH50_2933 [Haloplanus aerogenes]
MGIETQCHPGGGDDLVRASILDDRRQRRILAVLLDRAHPMTVHELGVHLVARANGIAPSDVTETECQSVRMDLRHRCLPKLASVGWIDSQPEGIVADDFSVETAVLSPPDLRNPDHPFWDVVSVVLARPYRQDLVSLVADRSAPVTVDELATELLVRETSATLPDDNRRLAIALHHIDLPKLASVGVIEYDPDERTVAPTDQLRRFVEWSNLEVG